MIAAVLTAAAGLILLDARARAARLEREGRAVSVRGEVERAVTRALPAGARIWLIGSLAWGGFGERSDVDLVTAGLTAAQALDLERAVARASGTPVEVLDLDALPAAFRARVLADGIPLP